MLAFVLAGPFCAAQVTPKVSFDASETLFTVLTAINSCGFDDGLESSNPIRTAVRNEVAAKLQADPSGEREQQLCRFYRDHQQQDSARDLAQYISLALSVGPPPTFTAKSDELPPDALYVAEIAPLLQTFYQVAGLRDIWSAQQREYQALLARHHDEIAGIIEKTDLYLRMPTSGYLGREFSILLDPMGPPARVNARVYSTQYYLVMSPNAAGALNMDAVSHLYLHYVLDPLAKKRPQAMKRLEPLLSTVMDAPLDETYKHDISLLVTESLIHAIEARRLQDGKANELAKQEKVNDAMEQGYVLTHYFYEALVKFEKEPTGFRDAFGDILAALDVSSEQKRAGQIAFVPRSGPDPLHSGLRAEPGLLDQAEQKLSGGDREGAQKLAEQALKEKQGDEGRALFVLARTSRDVRSSQPYFERAVEVAKEPRVIAWSHLYLGRIYDLRYHDAMQNAEDSPQGKAAAEREREQAVKHYQAALASHYMDPALKAAAEAGLKKPYQPAAARGGEGQNNQ